MRSTTLLRFVVCFSFLLVLLPLASASLVTDDHGKQLGTIDAAPNNCYLGFNLTANSRLAIYNVTLSNNTNAVRVIITNASGSVLGNASVTGYGGTAAFNGSIIIEAGQQFFVVAGNETSGWTRAYNTTAGAMPVNKTNVQFNDRVLGFGACGAIASSGAGTDYYHIQNISTDASFIAITFQNNTPSDGQIYFSNGSNQVNMNASVTGLSGVVGLDAFLYNSTGSLLARYYLQQSGDYNFTQLINTPNITGYKLNATAHNFSSAIVLDDSGNGRNLTSVNSPVINSTCGYGGTQGICFANQRATQQSGEAWLNVSKNFSVFLQASTTNYNTSGEEGIVEFYRNNTLASGAPYFIAGFRNSSNLERLHFRIDGNSTCGVTLYAGSTTDNDGTKRKYIMTWNGSQGNIYREGVFSNQGNISVACLANFPLDGRAVKIVDVGSYFGIYSKNATVDNIIIIERVANSSDISEYNSSLTIPANPSAFWSFDNVSYPFNATSEVRSFTVYNLTPGSITNPTNFTNQSTRFLNITWTNATVNPVVTNISLYHVRLYDADGSTLNRYLTTTSSLFYYWDVYAENLSTGLYWLDVRYNDSTGNYTASDKIAINITRNAVLNITAVELANGSVISNFSGWVYRVEDGLNISYNTTSNFSMVDIIRGNLTIYIESDLYAITNDTSYAYINVSVALDNLTFYLYNTNTLNITFYDQATPTVILSGPLISLDLISTLYANNYSTSNGTLYLTLLTPEDYTLRYSAPGYTERFYTVSISNRSAQAISLYLVNSSVSANVTITVVDEVTNPLAGVQVKALKYDLPSNDYILQEIATTGSNGQVVMTLTMFDEFYKFMVEEDGILLKTTDPEYITTTSKTIQVSTGQQYGQEMTQYGQIGYDLTFNNNSNNFRLDYSDSTGIVEEILMIVYVSANQTLTQFNYSSSTSASGTILVGVAAVNGTTYIAKAYYLEDGVYKYLDGETYTYPDGTAQIFGNMGLLAQIMLTLGMTSLVFVSPMLGVIVSPLTLVMGAYLGWIDFTPTVIAGYLLFMGLVYAVILAIKK